MNHPRSVRLEPVGDLDPKHIGIIVCPFQSNTQEPSYESQFLIRSEGQHSDLHVGPNIGGPSRWLAQTPGRREKEKSSRDPLCEDVHIFLIFSCSGLRDDLQKGVHPREK